MAAKAHLIILLILVTKSISGNTNYLNIIVYNTHGRLNYEESGTFNAVKQSQLLESVSQRNEQ